MCASTRARRDHDFRKERKEVKKKLICHYVVPIGATSWHSDHWQRYFTFWAMSHKVGCNARARARVCSFFQDLT